MIHLYNYVASLLGRAYYLQKPDGASPAVLRYVEARRAGYYQDAEHLLASALQKQGLAAEVARDAAFRFVAGILKGLADADALHESASA